MKMWSRVKLPEIKEKSDIKLIKVIRVDISVDFHSIKSNLVINSNASLKWKCVIEH